MLYGIIPYIPPPIIGIPDNPPCIITLGACKTQCVFFLLVFFFLEEYRSRKIFILFTQNFTREKNSLIFVRFVPPHSKRPVILDMHLFLPSIHKGSQHTQRSLASVWRTNLHFFFNAFPELLWDGCLCCGHVLYGAFDGNNSIRIHGRHLLNTVISIRIISTKKTHKPKKKQR